MEFKLFEKKAPTFNKEQAIKEIKKAYSQNKVEKLTEVINGYNGSDFEQVFREAMGDLQLEMVAKHVIEYVAKGNPHLATTTNSFQREYIDKFDVFCLVIYMIDKQNFLPESILDDELIIRINRAADRLGYKDIYDMSKMEKDCAGNPIPSKSKQCINFALDRDLNAIQDAQLRANFEKQISEIKAFLAKAGDYEYALKKDNAEPTKKEEEKKDKKSPFENKKEEDKKQEVAVVAQPAPAPVPQQQIYVGYNPATQQPAHMEPIPTTQPQPAAPVEQPTSSVAEDDEFDFEKLLASKLSPEKIAKLENAVDKMTADKASKIAETKAFDDAINVLFDLIIDGDQKEGAKSDKKDPRKSN